MSSSDRSEYNRKWYAKNRKRRVLAMRKYYKSNKKRLRTRQLDWHYANRELSLRRMKEWYKANRHKVLPRKREWNRRNYKLNRKDVLKRTEMSRLKRTYGLTLSEYKELAKKLNYMCAICGVRCKRLYIDHKVKGSFRGLLCPCCNSGLGMFKDSISNLQSAIRYLKVSQGK